MCRTSGAGTATLPENWSSPLVFLCGSCCSIFRFLCGVCRSLFVVLILLAIVLLDLRFTSSDYNFGVFKLLLFEIDWLIDWLIVFNATFSNISAISWRPVLVVEEAGVLGENHWPWASNWYTLSLATASRVHPFLFSYLRSTTYAVQYQNISKRYRCWLLY